MMRYRDHNRVFLCAIFICLFPLLSEAAPESVSLQLKWKHQFQFAGFYMAQEKGFYRDAGFDVEIKEVEIGLSVVNELQNGNADYVVLDPGVLLARAEGVPIKVLAAIFQHSPLALIVMRNSGIKSFSDLRGKRIMMIPGGLNADISAALGSAGLSTQDFVKQDISYDINDLVNGTTDAFSGYITDQTHQLDLMRVPYRVLHPKEQGVDFYGDILATTEKMVDEHPEKVSAFTRASMKGWEYALENIDETIGIILSKYNSQNFSLQHLQFEAKKTKEMIESDVVSIGFMRTQRWQLIADVYTKQGLLPKDFDISALLYQPQIKFSEIVKVYRWEFSVIALIILTLLCIMLGLHVVGLRRAVHVRTESLQKIKQNLMVKKAEAEKANVEKSVFLASASHDLRQPLHALDLQLDILGNAMQEQSLQVMLANAKQSSKALGGLLNALLDVSKLDAGVVEVNSQIVDLHHVLREITDEWQPQFLKFGRELRLKTVSVVVESDLILLKRILRNLISNALSHTEGNVLLGMRRRGQCIRIEIWDQGEGLKEAELEKIFSEFYQLKNSERDRNKGLGLGLAIVRRLAGLLQHPISVKSREGKGSCFSLELPLLSGSLLAGATSLSMQDERNNSYDVSGLFVLVVEDELPIRESMLQLLRSWECEVLVAATGQDAVQELRECNYPAPDVIIVDYRLREGETGLQVAGEVHALFEKSIPTIVVTGDTSLDLHGKYPGLGYKLLHKPLEAARLKEVLADLGGSRSVVASNGLCY